MEGDPFLPRSMWAEAKGQLDIGVLKVVAVGVGVGVRLGVGVGVGKSFLALWDRLEMKESMLH